MLFLQRCSVCHLPKEVKPTFDVPQELWWKTLPSYGPSLTGVFKNAKPDREKFIREAIAKGGPNMPGFQYGLEPKDIDALIAYLKTL
jgi:mono/diheme cytochrome c family protein